MVWDMLVSFCSMGWLGTFTLALPDCGVTMKGMSHLLRKGVEPKVGKVQGGGGAVADDNQGVAVRHGRLVTGRNQSVGHAGVAGGRGSNEGVSVGHGVFSLSVVCWGRLF